MNTVLTADLSTAAALVRAGGLVAFPTETVYGLGANGLSADAVRRLFAAKGRPADNPLILHVAEPSDAARLAALGPLAEGLARRFWPGPLTLVLAALPGIPGEVRAGLPTVAIRCPDHDLARALIRAAGCPLAAPSANRSGRPSPTTAQDVFEELSGRIDAILDGGPCRRGIESTVVDCTGPSPRLLRLGALPAEALGLAPRVDGAASERSPGTRHAHYAPAVPLHLCADLAEGLRLHPRAAVICRAEEARRLGLGPGPAVHVWSADPAARAAELYGALRRLERSGRAAIVASLLPLCGLDAATMDRLSRAAASTSGMRPSV